MRNSIKTKIVAGISIFFCCSILPFSFAAEGKIPLVRFKNADIGLVLQSIAQSATRDGKKVNIVVSPSVKASVTVNLEDVDWEMALKIILRAYGYSYDWAGENIVFVATEDELQKGAMSKEKRELMAQQLDAFVKGKEGSHIPLTKTFSLKYLDANDAKKAVEPVLSPAGKISVLELTSRAGWEFGSDVSKRQKAQEAKTARTKVLLVSDIPAKLAEIEKLIREIDVMPKQVLIKTKIVEVNQDVLDDLGIDWSTGNIKIGGARNVDASGHIWSDQVTPSGFDPQTGAITTANTGLQLVLKKLTGTQFEIVMHALDENVHTNTLSAPAVLTLNNQEASILVGTKFPIVKTEVSQETSKITGGSLDFYQDIGIQLNVIPQICGDADDFINMVIHPAVTSSTETVKVITQDKTTLVEYPIIISREAETQVIVKDGETIVIGGLLKDVKTKQKIGIPYLKDVPGIGKLFTRDTEDTAKIDLLIFITAQVVHPGEGEPQNIEDTSLVSSMRKREQYR